MTTTVRITRQTPFEKSDVLREDEELFAEAQTLRAWLAQRDIETVTMGQVLAFELTDHPDAVLDRLTIVYTWVWDPAIGDFKVECVDRGLITFVIGGSSDPVVIEITISAEY